MATITISLPESLKAFIEDEMEMTGYGNVSEYMRGLVRAEQAKRGDAQLEALLLEGLTSGKDIALTPGFWRELKADAARILAAKKNSGRRRAGK